MSYLRKQCPSCPLSFSRQEHLVRHSMVHLGIKPFTCPSCKKSFSRLDALQRHQRLHPNHMDQNKVPPPQPFTKFTVYTPNQMAKSMKSHSITKIHSLTKVHPITKVHNYQPEMLQPQRKPKIISKMSLCNLVN
ncbi:hypothetical protein BC833DRAFT_595530 [Globomyces pollinis-pini]|nr:hypothetical protein BC833DRAFT_595530 [Globomyces pollinis-pini]